MFDANLTRRLQQDQLPSRLTVKLSRPRYFVLRPLFLAESFP